jgi:hypothetical protein
MRSPVQDASLSPALVRRQLEKILHSGEFSGSEVLRNLLSFLAEQAIDRPGETVKEYELAVAVLGKPDGFDPRLDSAVRVHAARLRSKLAEYYMADGAEDPVLIEVPKGAYHLTWRQRVVEAPPISIPEPTQAVTVPAPFPWRIFALGFAAAATICAVTFASIYPKKPELPAVVAAFWQPFLKSPQEPLVVFSNHRFAGTSITGLHRFQDGVDPPSQENDTYSGTGTVMAVGELSNLFSMAGHSPRFKRAELLTWDEAKDANVVFVGAPDANSRLRELAPLQSFRFKSGYEEPGFGHGGIINVHPEPGEEAIYFGPPGLPYPFDYAVIALLPSLHSDRKVLILAGTNTYGCQAATEFLSHRETVNELYRRLGASTKSKLPDFEALIKVNISGGVPMRTDVVAVRRH